MNDKPREYTEDEVREKFLEHVWILVDYWDKNEPNKREAMEGLAFSILSTLDGCTIDLPGFAVIPRPHEGDKDYCIEENENYFPQFDSSQHCDISGYMHELFFKAKVEQ